MAALTVALIAGLVLVPGVSGACTRLPPASTNAQWKCSMPAAEGSTCTAVCNSPDYASSPPQTTCMDGTWDTAVPPQCFRICTAPPSASLIVGTGTWNPECATTRVNARCSALCSGETPFGSPSALCISGTSWSFVYGRCLAAPGCARPPPPILNGRWNELACFDTPVGSTCTGSCNSGYTAVGATVTSTCTAGGSPGTWSQPSIVCSRARPPAPAPSPSPPPITATCFNDAQKCAEAVVAGSVPSVDNLGHADAMQCVTMCLQTNFTHSQPWFISMRRVDANTECSCSAACSLVADNSFAHCTITSA